MIPVSSLLLAVGGSALFLWLLLPMASRMGLVDRPDARKIHDREVPLVGGLALFLGFTLAMTGFEAAPDPFRAMLLAMALLVSIGVIDDRRGVSPRIRFGVQIVAALLMTSWGQVSVGHLGNLMGWGAIELGGWAAPFTVICVVGVINAFNMSDGLDGLAGGQALLSFGMLCFLAVLAGHAAEGWILAFLMLTLLPFLWLNARGPWRDRALVFMGDAGSTCLGFALAWFTVQLSQGEARAFQPVTALWLVAVPLIDMFGVFFRRLARGEKPFEPDNRHLHHLLLKRCGSVSRTCLILWAASLACGFFGMAGMWSGIPEYMMFYGILALFVAYLVWSSNEWNRMAKVER
ncbi:MAG: undecaprenyl/decaprenyl-phosphate alpha-N-acetylglucosaminyl 1-phosphate transferase [Magnetococcales bacterium]|nr:undecaprenyl/decaprenyl-phosphate alpha-N-acetylglucosaminyl 1-phosphate transferase [Magnetococcales bacterium]